MRTRCVRLPPLHAPGPLFVAAAAGAFSQPAGLLDPVLLDPVLLDPVLLDPVLLDPVLVEAVTEPGGVAAPAGCDEDVGAEPGCEARCWGTRGTDDDGANGCDCTGEVEG